MSVGYSGYSEDIPGRVRQARITFQQYHEKIRFGSLDLLLLVGHNGPTSLCMKNREL